MLLLNVTCRFFIFFLIIYANNVFGKSIIKTEQPSISITLNSVASVRYAFIPIIRQFEQETGIKVNTRRFVENAEFEYYINKWLVEGTDSPDVLYGHSAQRFLSLVEQGLVHPLTELWQKNNWQANFPTEMVKWISDDNEIYALPYSYYTWGLFFKSDLTNKFGAVPQDWQQFKQYCHRLKKNGITPFPASEKQAWIASAWFEYLILRFHGLTLFEQITAGEISFNDERIQTVLSEWKQMVDSGFFSGEYFDLRWEEYLPYFYRDKFAFVLMNTNIGSRIFNEQLMQQIEYMPFPKISDIPRYESGPTDIFFIPKQSKNKLNAQRFIKYLARADIQSEISKQLHASPANIKSTVGEHKFAQLGHNSLINAKGLSAFFDRATQPGFSNVSVNLFSTFLQNGDDKTLTLQLEQARLRYYPKR